MKKLLSIILAILMIVTTVPFAFAADVVTSGRDNGEDRDITWIIDSDRVLTISGSGLVGGRFYNFRDLFDTVIIEDGITEIASNVFASTYIKKAILPDSITSIGKSAFSSCSQLEEITIPDSVTYIGESAFSYCSGLKEITIPDSVTYIGESAFYSCSGLKEITLPYGLTSIEKNTFYSCGALEKITIPDSVETIGVNAFILCGALKNITIPDSVKTIEKLAFCNCRALETLTIPDGVVSIGDQAFSGCSNLKEITIPESVTSIGNSAFYGINENAIVNVPCSWDENPLYRFYTPSIAPNINSHIWSVDGSFGICDACGKKCDHTYLLEAKCSICGFENKPDGIKTVLDFSKGCIIITDSKASCGYADVRFDPDGYIITGECRDEYGAPITIINDSGEGKTFDLVFRDLNINALDGYGAVRIVDNSPTTVNILVEGENVLTTNDRSMFIGGGDWYFGQPITKINVNLTKAENATIQFERLDGMAEIELFYFYDGNFIFTVDGKPVGGDMHFHENTDGIQSCKGYLCSICEQYYGEKDENAHEAGYQNCQGYFCDVCHDYFGEGTAHGKSYQSCMGWFCNGCQKFNYPEEKDESKHVWVYGICTYCRVAFPEGQECIHEWDVEMQCTKCAYKCEHQFVENNICSVCNSEMNFTLTTGDTVTYHKFFARALDKAENGSKITLINDYYYGDNYDVFIQNNIIIDLNGHKWCPEPYLNLHILADVTIKGATLEGYYTPSLRIYSPCKLYDGYYRSIMMENPEIEIDDLLPECRVFTAGEIYDTGLYYEEIAVTGEHSFTEYKEVKSPACEEEGLKVAECDNGCGETDEQAIEALTHTFTKYETTEEAKCGVAGKEIAYCDNGCGKTDEKTLEALTHEDADGDYICDHGCGYEFDKPEDPAKDVCDDCGKIHKNFFSEIFCFFAKIINFFKNIFA